MTDVLALLARSTLALSAGIALVLLVRVPARRLSGARVAYALWLVPLLAAAAALVPKPRSAAQVPAPVAAVLQAVPPAFAQAVSSVETLPIRSSAAPASARRAAPFALLALWASGAVASLGILGVRQRRYVRSLGLLTRVARGPAIVYQADSAAAGPALVGVLRPRIVIPADFEARFTPDEQRLIVAHELAHLRAGDAQINALAALVCSLQWFNPLVHLASRLVRIDQELACDAAVVARAPLGRRDYAAAMPHFRLALEFKADSWSSNYSLGNCLQITGGLAEAQEHYFRALELNPESAEINNNLGMLHLRQERCVEAIEHFRRALQLRPDLANARDNLQLAISQHSLQLRDAGSNRGGSE